MAVTQAQFALYVAKINRLVSMTAVHLAEGMWNPDFCASDGTGEAMSLIEDLRRQMDWLEKRCAGDPVTKPESK